MLNKKKVTEFVEAKSKKIGNILINDYINELLNRNEVISTVDAESLFEIKWKEIE